ncbi:hypothetical protein BWQ96_07456 [Gracilariopsis chorda]|uniref:Uncharacterized protein n=1 Tax=Gracilariopsis chorda TaxID=448386 RepID=A0A2V3IL36_9FLOR|nr:hypothetical protein BWQ96_07456 [Gracilariopsis chorda]|eukprot:PXF42805.1 hypothetical protein BWQ96_07456 [Gracilariopsis chorda]
MHGTFLPRLRLHGTISTLLERLFKHSLDEDEKKKTMKATSRELACSLIATGSLKRQIFVDRRNCSSSSPGRMRCGRGNEDSEERVAYLTLLFEIPEAARLDPRFVDVIVQAGVSNLYAIPSTDRIANGEIWASSQTASDERPTNCGCDIEGTTVLDENYA